VGVGAPTPDPYRRRYRRGDGADYQAFASTDLMDQLALERMLSMLSTRRYPAGLESVGSSVQQTAGGTFKSAVSRRFVARTEHAVAELRAIDQHRPVRAAGRAGDAHRAVRLGDARVWVVDNGSSHRGRASIQRLEGEWANLRLVHLPVHASWLNQAEIYFSDIQPKVPAPNDFLDLGEVAQRLLGFQRRYQRTAVPFGWRFTRADLTKLLRRLDEHERPATAA
jgi:hypothetical protein